MKLFREDPFYTPGTAEPIGYSPAELVVYEHELVFGHGEFVLLDVADTYPQFCYAYLFLAQSLEKLGRTNEAVENYEKYIARESDKSNVAYAKRCLEHLKSE